MRYTHLHRIIVMRFTLPVAGLAVQDGSHAVKGAVGGGEGKGRAPSSGLHEARSARPSSVRAEDSLYNFVSAPSMKRSNAVSTPRVFDWFVSGSEGSAESPNRARPNGAIRRTALMADQITSALHCKLPRSIRSA